MERGVRNGRHVPSEKLSALPMLSDVASVSINVCRCVVVACDEVQDQVGEAKKN